MQRSLEYANGGLQVLLVTVLPFTAPGQVRREVSCRALAWLSDVAAHMYACVHTHMEITISGKVQWCGLWKDSFFILPGTDRNTQQYVRLYLCFALSLQKAVFRISHLFFLFKSPLITCSMQNGSSLNRIYPKPVLIKQ